MGKITILYLLFIILMAMLLIPVVIAENAHTSPQLLWKYNASNGPIFGCPAENNGIIYFTSGDKVFAVDNGSLSWERSLGAPSRASVYYHDNRLYAGDNGGNVTVMDAADGNVIWTFHTGSSVHARVEVFNEKVYVSSKDRNLYCLDMDGNLLWTYETADALRSDPCFYDGNVYFNGDDWNFYAVDADSGKLAWKSGIRGQTGPKAVEYGGRIFTTAYVGGMYCFDAGSGWPEWSKNKDEQIVYGNILVYKDTLFVTTTTSGKVYSINPFTGGVYWSANTTYSLGSDMLASGNAIILTDKNGSVIEMDSEHGSIVSSTKVTDGTLPGRMLLVEDKTLYLGDSEGCLYAYRITPYHSSYKVPLIYFMVGGLVFVIFGMYIIKRQI